MTRADFLALLEKEEGTVFRVVDQPTGPLGVTLPMLSRWRGHTCTVDDLKALTLDDAKQLLSSHIDQTLKLLGFDRILFEPLRYQLLDFGWQSGEERAVRYLQRSVGLSDMNVTGIIDDRTIAALNTLPPILVNNDIAARRAHADYTGAVAPAYAAGTAHRAIMFVINNTGGNE